MQMKWNSTFHHIEENGSLQIRSAVFKLFFLFNLKYIANKTKVRKVIEQIAIFMASWLADLYIFVPMDKQSGRTPILHEKKISVTLS